MAKPLPINWDLDTLHKAYRQGYMAGVMGMALNRCPYRGEIVVAAWEAGWEDGWQDQQEQRMRRRSA